MRQKLPNHEIAITFFLWIILTGNLFFPVDIAQCNSIQDVKPQFHQAFFTEFRAIQMINKNDSWAQAGELESVANVWMFRKELILRTKDGGESWMCVLSLSPGQSVKTYFSNSQFAWIAAYYEYGATDLTFFGTTNGGTSWTTNYLCQTHPILDCSLSFPLSNKGWLMLVPEHGMNSSPADLYLTQDKGLNWQKINSTDLSPREWIWENATLPEFGNRHSYLICGGSMAFRSDYVGWLWGSLASTSPSFLFITQDGGRNWQVQLLPLLPQFQGGRIDPIGSPQFFWRGKNGILPTQFVQDSSSSASFATIIYTTHDGGSS